MPSFFSTILTLLCAYSIGAFPTGYLLALLFSNTDLRTFGSGTVGASNVARVLGPIGFILVFLCDMSKAYALLFLSSFFFSHSLLVAFFSSMALVLGNIFSYGATCPRGKGVATALGCLLFFDTKLFFLFAAIWIAFILICKVPTYASLMSSFVVLVASFCLNSTIQTKFFLIVLQPILFYTHRVMLQKFLSHERVIWCLRQLLKRLPRSKQ